MEKDFKEEVIHDEAPYKVDGPAGKFHSTNVRNVRISFDCLSPTYIQAELAQAISESYIPKWSKDSLKLYCKSCA